MRFYSKTTRGFYDSEIHGTPGHPGCVVPEDAVEVPEDAYTALMAGQSAGQEIAPDADGHPVLRDRVYSDADLGAMARARRVPLLANADAMVNTMEDNGESATAWRAYRQLLRDVPKQPGFPATINWPAAPAA